MDSVLIETLWNVNNNTLLLYQEAVKVLIETLWNVNCDNPRADHYISRINRNIVECKFVFWVYIAMN